MSYLSSSNSQLKTSVGKEGLGEQSWWVEQWMQLINSYRYKKRLERAWNYAREGNVVSIRFEGRRIHARVQGTEKEPYKVKLWLDVLDDEDWKYVLEAMAKRAKWSAQLLAGVMPKDIETAFAASGKRLFPFKLEEVKSECTCPDKANPCKHISAIYFLMGDRFREDPFILFQLRGRGKIELLSDLAKERQKNFKENIELNVENKAKVNRKEIKNVNKRLYTPSFTEPSLWWSYNYDLDSDLVVITPGLESETGISTAGDLPLAEDPKFPNSRTKFLNHLISFCQEQAHKAMLIAMNPNT